MEKKRNGRRFEEYRIISLIARSINILPRILTQDYIVGRMRKKIWRGTVWCRITYGRYSFVKNIIREVYRVYVAFVDLENAFDRVNWKVL